MRTKSARLLFSSIVIASLALVASARTGHAAPAHHLSLLSAVSRIDHNLAGHRASPDVITPPANEDWYDINASDLYCSDGTTNCIAPCIENDYCAGAVYAAVDAIGTTPFSNSGTPGEIVMTCVKGNADGSYTGGYLDVYTTAQVNEFDLDGIGGYGNGSITGKAVLVTPNADETKVNAEGSLNVSA